MMTGSQQRDEGILTQCTDCTDSSGSPELTSAQERSSSEDPPSFQPGQSEDYGSFIPLGDDDIDFNIEDLDSVCRSTSFKNAAQQIPGGKAGLERVKYFNVLQSNTSTATTAQASRTKRKMPQQQEAGGQKRRRRRAAWRKYGQKMLKGEDCQPGKKLLRGYFRCTHEGCEVRKHVVMCAWSNVVESTTIHGRHNHAIEPELELEPTKEDTQAADNDTQISIPTSNQPSFQHKPIPPIDRRYVDMVMEAHPHFVIADTQAPDCPIIYTSQGFLELTGFSMHEAIGRNCRFLQGKDSDVAAIRLIGRAVREKKEIHVILLNYKKDNTPFWNLLHLNPIVGEDGIMRTIVGAQQDVSNLVEANQKQILSSNTQACLSQLLTPEEAKPLQAVLTTAEDVPMFSYL